MSEPDRVYLSIGEVLSLLREEFPDVTISKIRFLESQGLLDPERTPSGYRKFYDNDVDRLRWILRQQRENFLPLKVIKGRLRDATGEPIDDDGIDQLPLDGEPTYSAPAGPAAAPMASAAPSAPNPPATAARASNPSLGMPSRGDGAGLTGADVAAAFGAGPNTDPPLVQGRTGASMTLAELSNATGLEDDELRELERFGLLAPRKVGSNAYYDEDALLVANLAAGFMRFGVEARHLRMYKVAAEREGTFFEQVVMPMLKQRNPQARRQATDTLVELSRLGQSLRGAMLRLALRQYLES